MRHGDIIIIIITGMVVYPINALPLLILVTPLCSNQFLSWLNICLFLSSPCFLFQHVDHVPITTPPTTISFLLRSSNPLMYNQHPSPIQPSLIHSVTCSHSSARSVNHSPTVSLYIHLSSCCSPYLSPSTSLTSQASAQRKDQGK